MTNTTAAQPSTTLAQLFEPILAELRARPANPAAPNATVQQRVQAIRDEAAKGSTASPLRIASWLGELGAFAPDIRGLVAGALRQPRRTQPVNSSSRTRARGSGETADTSASWVAHLLT